MRSTEQGMGVGRVMAAAGVGGAGRFLTAVALMAGLGVGTAGAQSFVLQVSRAGFATGTITSDPAGIDCGTTCQASFPAGTVVTLSVSGTPDVPRWRGDCESTPACTVTIGGFTHAIAEMAPPATGLKILRSFLAGGLHDGITPRYAEPVTDGTFWYGNTSTGGGLGGGVVYRMLPDGNGYTLLHSFAGGSADGRRPNGTLTLAGDVLFGMTAEGGPGGLGTVFRINTDGTGFTLLHAFAGGGADGSTPSGALTRSGDVLFGMTSSGGSSDRGTVFKVNTDGSGFALLRSFAGGSGDGAAPYGSLTLSGNVLYGMTRAGGTRDRGVIFKLNTDGLAFVRLHSFARNPTNGSEPYGSLTLSGGVLYGLTSSGGASDQGTVFCISAEGTGFALLRSFSGGADGSTPYGSLVLSGSVLIGMTSAGGANGQGAIFKINTGGTGFGVLRSFAGGGADGRSPFGSLALSGSVLYGMTTAGGSSDAGTVFQVNIGGTGFVLLHSFTHGSGDGMNPWGSLTLSEGVLYGMTHQGGSDHQGTIFKINTDGTGFERLRAFTGADGGKPSNSLTVSGNVLYGVTTEGGDGWGTIFSVDTDGTDFAVLHSFTGGSTDGSVPSGSLILSGSVLYGMTTYGGTSDAGTIFKVNTNGTDFELVHPFLFNADGRRPTGSLALSDGVLYGMTRLGGTADFGTIFKVKPDGSEFEVLHSFAGGSGGGKYPYGSLTLSGTELRGMTSEGGASGRGTIFKVNTDGSGFALLHTFTGGGDGSTPYGALTLSEGVLHGMTFSGGSDQGTVFKVKTDGSEYTLLRSFTGGASNGAAPKLDAPVLAGGVLYGMTTLGGLANAGTVFAMTVGPPHTITPSAGTGGSISPATPQSVSEGDSITFTISPDTGYHVADVLVDGATVGPVTSHTFPNVTANHTIVASFVLDIHRLTVTRTGTGTGSVTSSPGGIDCGGTCEALFSHGTVVTLSHAASADSAFAGWTGACTGTGECAVTMDAAQAVTARFDLLPAPAITSDNHATFTVGVADTFTVTATGTPTPSLAATGALPAGVTFTDHADGTATLGGTPEAGTGGTYTLTLTAHNGVGADAVQAFTLTVDQPTAITSPDHAEFVVGKAGSHTITTSGFPVPSLSHSGPLPSGVIFTDHGDGTGTLAGTPEAGTAGDYPLTVTAHNGVGAGAEQAFTLAVGILGDVNGDGSVNVSDVFYLINNLFAGGPAPTGPADVNGDAQVNVADVFYLINYLFAGGPAPA